MPEELAMSAAHLFPVIHIYYEHSGPHNVLERRACFANVVFRPIRLASGTLVELHAMWRSEDRNPALPVLRSLILRDLGLHMSGA